MALGVAFWIAFSVAALIVATTALAFFLKSEKRRNVSPLLGIAFACIIVSMTFDAQTTAYSLLGVGVVLAILDVVLKKMKDRREAVAEDSALKE